MLALRRRIETRGARKAVRHIDDRSLAELARLRSAMMDAATAGDEYRLIEADKAFHLAIFHLTGLNALEQILARCILHSHRCKAVGARPPPVFGRNGHASRCSLDRLVARDGKGLAEALVSTSTRSCLKAARRLQREGLHRSSNGAHSRRPCCRASDRFQDHADC